MTDETGTASTLSSRVVRAVAAREQRNIVDLETPLFDAVDPDALDSLFSDDRGSVRFHYRGFEVTAFADGRVDVDDA